MSRYYNKLSDRLMLAVKAHKRKPKGSRPASPHGKINRKVRGYPK